MSRRLLAIAWAFVVSGLSVPALAKDPPLLIIYDSSNSMWGELADGSRKYEAGRRALKRALQNMPQDRLVALMAYGHRDASSCTDTELLRPFAAAGEGQASTIQAVENIRPTGKTPISSSLRESLKILPGSRGEILLISDGLETCDLDPCELVENWQEREVNVRIHVVGVGLSDVERLAMSCVAATSDGTYIDANSDEDFTAAVARVSERSTQRADADEQGSYVLLIRAVDELEQRFVAAGTLRSQNQERPTIDVRTHGRNVLSAPGDYSLTMGVLLQDGSIYQPQTVDVSISEPGETKVTIVVPRPASVSASFEKAGEHHRGALITAFLDGAEVFKLRPGDRALAGPGAYTFRSAPEADNQLALQAQLIEGEHTDLLFEMAKTVNVRVQIALPGGEKIQRVVELWQEGEQKYRFHGGHGAMVLPGEYDLRSDDPITPIHSYELRVEPEDQTYEVPVVSGYVVLEYAGDARDFTGNADRGFLKSFASGKQVYMVPGQPVAAAPGRYQVVPHKSAGYFDPQTVDVLAGETITAVVEAKATGALIATYRECDLWSVPPDRAFVSSPDGLEIRRSFLRPGVAVRLLPGRYLVSPWKQAGDADPVAVNVVAGETQTVELSLPR